ncbi:FtsH protease activity modulator HflK [Sphingomonas ginkgonis]|uniref:Protein HflK n=2 Tax=Sphingomonas ginkgonis TaxID=2315330 RepID=A0A429VDV6_9SPHN|nr:FtsH protease activity modulator HflK [Sphingomonas ginkgonis]
MPGWAALGRALFNDNKGPWGSRPPGGDKGAGGSGGEEPPSVPPSGGHGSGPWGGSPQRRSTGPGLGGVPLEELLRRRLGRLGGGGGGGPFPTTDRSIFAWAALAVVLLWLLVTSVHSIDPQERGVVTRFGRYDHTLGPGIGLTLPFPIDRVRKVDVGQIRNVDLGSANSDNLMLTGDQNILDIAYTVRWTVRDPELFLFEMKSPEETVREVAESAMRAVISNVSLNDAMGERRGQIEGSVVEEMQHILDRYHSGVLIQGVAIKQADPPGQVIDAFKQVTAAQQDAQSYVNQATGYAQQLTAKAQGEATAFDKVYEQYRLSPDVTRRRMYYETMEQVLANTDKTIVEAPGITPYLPLPEVRKSSPAAQEPQQ